MLLAHGLLKQNRQIVDNGVASTQLLEDLRRRTNQHTTEVLRRAPREQITELDIFIRRARPVLVSILFTAKGEMRLGLGLLTLGASREQAAFAVEFRDPRFHGRPTRPERIHLLGYGLER